jgi:hypothetical protein
MPWLPKSQDHLPLNWWRGQPVYLAAYLAIGAVASMVVTSLIMAAHTPLLHYFIFTFSGLVDMGRVWTIATYVLINPPSIWVIISSAMLWMWGQEVEKFFGRRVFVKMFLIFIISQPILLSLIVPFAGPLWPAMGVYQVEFAVFLAFVTLYPHARISLILITLEAWIIATAFVAIDVLQCLAGHNWGGLILILGETAVAYGLVRYEQGQWSFGSLLPGLKKRLTRRSEPQLRVVRRNREEPIPSFPDLDVDSILDKIGKHGLESLTPEERRTLEKASKDLRGRGN